MSLYILTRPLSTGREAMLAELRTNFYLFPTYPFRRVYQVLKTRSVHVCVYSFIEYPFVRSISMPPSRWKSCSGSICALDDFVPPADAQSEQFTHALTGRLVLCVL